jgi:hypothetical protein
MRSDRALMVLLVVPLATASCHSEQTVGAERP